MAFCYHSSHPPSRYLPPSFSTVVPLRVYIFTSCTVVFLFPSIIKPSLSLYPLFLLYTNSGYLLSHKAFNRVRRKEIWYHQTDSYIFWLTGIFFWSEIFWMKCKAGYCLLFIVQMKFYVSNIQLYYCCKLHFSKLTIFFKNQKCKWKCKCKVWLGRSNFIYSLCVKCFFISCIWVWLQLHFLFFFVRQIIFLLRFFSLECKQSNVS